LRCKTAAVFAGQQLPPSNSCWNKGGVGRNSKEA